MMDMDNEETHLKEDDNTVRIPNQRELEKELSEYLSKKYGSRVKIISPFFFPKTEEEERDAGVQGRESGDLFDFDSLPEELEAYLDSYVVKQKGAKAILATKVCTHFNRIKYSRSSSGKNKASKVGMIKNNVLMIGPTGVGKTYIIKLIAQKLGVPFAKGDATKFSETGYVGGDVEDLVRDLVYEAGDDIERAENGIIYVDEIDKIASSRNFIGHDVSRTGVQRALLKPMEETDVDLKVPHDPISQIQAIENYRKTGKREKRVVNTKNILFIMSGAFGDLSEIIIKRLQSQGIGFEANVRSTEVPWEILKEVTAQDLIAFGFESEFIGRLPVIVVFDELKKEDLTEILKNPNNPILISKRLDFRAYGIDIRFEDEALGKLAEIAAKEKTGARGLVSAIEKVLVQFEKRLPTVGIKQFLVTPEVVNAPDEQLALLLEQWNTPAFRDRFDRAVELELAGIQKFILDHGQDFQRATGLELTEKKADILSRMYLKNICDVNAIYEDFIEMYGVARREEVGLAKRLDANISFDESAVDALIFQAIELDRKVAILAEQLCKRLEYGLNLVKARSGVRQFVITDEAVFNLEVFIDNLIKRFPSLNPLSEHLEI
jgi:ATP-dependent Clp protease ATP-binding subunit ClpX